MIGNQENVNLQRSNQNQLHKIAYLTSANIQKKSTRKLFCIYFLHLVEKLRFQLINDEYFDTQLLFRSPSGDGLKWIISLSPPVGDLGGYSHGDYFAAVANYILQTYGVEVDKSGRDISRACFLPHDPQAFINPTNLK